MTAKAGSTLSSQVSFLPGRILASAALLVLLSGCGQPTKAPTTAKVTGTYTLIAVDGKDVPASVAHDGTALQVKSGTFVISDDGTCSSVVVFVPPSGAEVDRQVNATYTLEGSSLRMQWQGAGTTTGSVDGETFTMNNEGMIFTYRRSPED